MVQLEASGYAFAALLPDASVVTWGNRYYGGSRKEVQDHLKDVIRLKASARAFAALVDGCRLVTWGDPRAGGDSSMVAVMF